MRYQTLVIEGSLPTLNEYINTERSNKYAGAKLKKKTEQAIKAWIKRSEVKPVGSYPIHMEYTWYCKDKRTDKSNISSMGQKLIEDSLQKAGIIRNDGWGEIANFEHAFLVDKKHPRIEVVLIEFNQDNLI
jgi:Holliday junction resolvase RusA-like endonuclease